MRFILLLAAAMLAAIGAHAQDKLHLKNGSTLEGKVQEIAPRYVSYKRADNPTGPSYFLNRSEVQYIEFENGTTDYLGKDGSRGNSTGSGAGPVSGRRAAPARRPAREQRNYGSNVLAIAPINMTQEGVRGLGLYYERVVDKRSIIAATLGAAVTFPNNNNNNFWGGPMFNTYERSGFTHVYPGVKFYPGGSRGVVRYGIGPTLAFGFGHERYSTTVTDPLTNQNRLVFTDNQVALTGIMISNSLNINATEHLYIGMELGLGFTYNDVQRYNSSNGTQELVNFNFKVGYRF